MSSAFGGVGRPSHTELARRRSEFVRLILDGAGLAAAAEAARVKPARALAILDELELLRVVTLDREAA